jgi:hypothetical protein
LDLHVDQEARHRNLPIMAFPVHKNVDGLWPKAGPRRNFRMLRDSRPNDLIVFPGHRGTASCVRFARGLSIPIIGAATLWFRGAPSLFKNTPPP